MADPRPAGTSAAPPEPPPTGEELRELMADIDFFLEMDEATAIESEEEELEREEDDVDK